MNEIVTPEEVTVRPTAESFAKFIAAKGYEVDPITVELTFAFHAEWQSSDVRRNERETAKADRAKAAKAAKAKRETEREARLLAEKTALEAKLAKLTSQK